MSEQPEREDEDTTFLGTLGWVAVVAGLAVVALLVLSWVGPLGDL